MSVKLMAAVVTALALVPMLLLFLVRYVLARIGDSLRSKTDFRREKIYTHYRLAQKVINQRKNSDDGWEKVEKDTSAQKTQKNEWNGIVGFFHPFWYVDSDLWRSS